MFTYKKLQELFYSNAHIKFTHINASDETQMEYQTQKIKNGCRMGCISNTQGAFVLTDDFAFVDCSYKSIDSETMIRPQGDSEYTLMYLTDRNLRKVLFYQYKTAFEKSKKENAEFTIEDIMQGCNLSESEATAALKCLKEIHLNEVYTERATKEKKYVFQISNAVYALAIYKLAELLSEDDPVWIAVRDTSMISDYAFQ